ncbi:hypothetical protein ACJX0J_020902, partial [Zea mays]
MTCIASLAVSDSHLNHGLFQNQIHAQALGEIASAMACCRPECDIRRRWNNLLAVALTDLLSAGSEVTKGDAIQATIKYLYWECLLKEYNSNSKPHIRKKISKTTCVVAGQIGIGVLPNTIVTKYEMIH